MLQYTIDNNGDVHFYPMEQNSAFKVLIFARPEAVDEITRTAVADQSETVRFTTNLLEFVGLPEKIWHAGTSARSASGFGKAPEIFQFLQDMSKMGASLVFTIWSGSQVTM